MAGRPMGFESLVRALAKLTPVQLKNALGMGSKIEKVSRLQREREKHLAALKKIERQISQLSGSNGGTRRVRRKLSAATRRKMALAAKRRWANEKGGSAPAKRARRTLSPETRAKMAEAAKRRWAKARGEAKPPENA